MSFSFNLYILTDQDEFHNDTSGHSLESYSSCKVTLVVMGAGRLGVSDRVRVRVITGAVGKHKHKRGAGHSVRDMEWRGCPCIATAKSDIWCETFPWQGYRLTVSTHR